MSALDALSAAEKAVVLDELLRARAELREPAEAYAARLMKRADRFAVADDVAGALRYLAIDELNTRAGYRPGFGYVNPSEADLMGWVSGFLDGAGSRGASASTLQALARHWATAWQLLGHPSR
jgi:hypothetical protein